MTRAVPNEAIAVRPMYRDHATLDPQTLSPSSSAR
jgi:hypothetical protein